MRLPAALRGGYPLGILTLVGLYYGAAHLGYAFSFAGPVASIVWLPVGVGISFLYLGGVRFWPGIVIGDLLVNNYTTLPVGSALVQSVGNLMEVVLAAMVLRRLSARGSLLGSIAGLAGMLLTLLGATLLSASIGSTALFLGGVISSSMWPHVWRTWLLGDFCGALILFPLALAWARPLPRHWLRGRRAEAAALVIALVGVSELALHTSAPLAYIVFPALIWAALRFGQRGATAAIVISSGMTVWGTTHYVGPFVYQSINRSVLSTQLFIVVASLSALSVAALVSEREELGRRIRLSRARMVEAADNERRRLERNLHDGAQQRLIALAAHLGMAARQSEAEPGKAPELFDSAADELLLAIDELRELAHGIHPSALRDYGLARAVEAVAARSSVPITLDKLPRKRLDDTAEATAYYVVAEAVNNAQKYADASQIRVRAELRRGSVMVEVADDGRGGAQVQAGSGLEGLRDRVEAVGGRLGVESLNGHGTRVSATVPATVVGTAV